jgi:hypothetical protein
MTIEATIQWSDIARNPREVAATVEREGEARLERRGEGQAFVLMTATRFTASRSGVRMVERLLRNAIAHSIQLGDLDSLLLDTFPWLRFIPESHRSDFGNEFVNTFEACAELDVWTPLQRMMREWKATAAVYADPQLSAKLKGPFEDDLGTAMPPEAVTEVADGSE